MQSEGYEEGVDVSGETLMPLQASPGAVNLLNMQHSSNQAPSEGIEAGTAAGFPLGAGEQSITYTQLEPGYSMSCVAYPYVDPYSCGLFAAYGGQSMIYQHMLGAHQSRRLLPSDMTEEEPVYVNAKQYNGIMRRRQSRAKAESENKLVKSRKPYLHESRHLHAKRRARGCGGRFSKAKSDEDTKTQSNEEPEGQALQGGNTSD